MEGGHMGQCMLKKDDQDDPYLYLTPTMAKWSVL